MSVWSAFSYFLNQLVHQCTDFSRRRGLEIPYQHQGTAQHCHLQQDSLLLTVQKRFVSHYIFLLRAAAAGWIAETCYWTVFIVPRDSFRSSSADVFNFSNLPVEQSATSSLLCFVSALCGLFLVCWFLQCCVWSVSCMLCLLCFLCAVFGVNLQCHVWPVFSVAFTLFLH